MGALWLSVRLAAVVTAVSLVLGVAAGFALSRRSFLGSQALAAAFLSPLVLPTVVIGVAMLQFTTTLGFARTFLALAVSHVVVVMPYVVRTTLAALARFEPVTEEAAQDLGATPMATFLLVTLPQIKPGIIAGGLFAFIILYSNVEVSIFQSRHGLITFPVKLFDYVQYSLDPLLAAASAITILFAVIAIVALDSRSASTRPSAAAEPHSVDRFPRSFRDRRSPPGIARLEHRHHPMPVFGDQPLGDVEVSLADAACQRAYLPVADRVVIDRADGQHLRATAAEEQLIRDIQFGPVDIALHHGHPQVVTKQPDQRVARDALQYVGAGRRSDHHTVAHQHQAA